MVPSGGRGPDGIMIAAHDVYDRQAGRWHGYTAANLAITSPSSRQENPRDRPTAWITRAAGSTF